MQMEEKRKYARIDSLNLLNYLYYEDNEEDANQGMGRTLNISEAGILLETHTPLQPPNKVSLTIGMKEDVVDIRGRVVYMKQNPDGLFESGISFEGLNNGALQVLRRYITAFNETEV